MRIALVVGLVALGAAAIELVAGTFDPMILVFLAPVFVAATLRPARHELVSRGAFVSTTRRPVLLGTVGPAIVPAGLSAIGQVSLQLALTDEYAALAHHSSRARYVGTSVVLAALVAVGARGRRVMAWAAGLMAAWPASVSWVQPTVSAITSLWTWLATLWG